jgi:ribosome biogenesis GTPase A
VSDGSTATTSILTDSADRSLDDFMRKTFGAAFVHRAPQRSDLVTELLKKNRNLLGDRRPRVALAGPTYVGKSSIFNAIFGRRVQAESTGTSDTTGFVAEVQLGGVLLYDTPGVGGLDEAYARFSRRFLGLSRSRTNASPAAPIPFRVYGDPGASPLAKGLGKRVEGHDPTLDQDYWDCELALDSVSPEFDLILVCFALNHTLEATSVRLFKELRRRHPAVILVGTKRDLADDPKIERIQEQATSYLGERFRPVSVKVGFENTLRDLLSTFFARLPESSLATLNQQLSDKFRRERKDLFEELLRRIAAKTAVERVDRKVDELNLPVLQAALFGLVLKLVMDFDMTKVSIREAVKNSLLKAASSVTAERTLHETTTILQPQTRVRPVQRVQYVSETRKRTVFRRRTIEVNEAAPGALGGGIAGAVVGALAGPVGVAIGFFGGALFGWLLGGSRVQRKEVTIPEVIEEVIQIPRVVVDYERFEERVPVSQETVRPLSGGARAALAVVCFGRVFYSELERIEKEGRQTIRTAEFEKGIEALLSELTPRLTDSARAAIDQATDERAVYELLEPVFRPMPGEAR